MRKDGKMARPTKMTEQVLKDLRAAFLIGATKEEASAYAGISKVTLYNYIEKNPEFMNEIEAWQDEPILKAKRKVVSELDKDVKNAQWYLERKRRDEFATKSEISGNIDFREKVIQSYGGREGGINDIPRPEEITDGSSQDNS